MDSWFVYILECSDKTLYTGITKDIERRLIEHNSSSLGAKYTRGRRPVVLVSLLEVENQSMALKEELRIKRLPRNKKSIKL